MCTPLTALVFHAYMRLYVLEYALGPVVLATSSNQHFWLPHAGSMELLVHKGEPSYDQFLFLQVPSCAESAAAVSP